MHSEFEVDDVLIAIQTNRDYLSLVVRKPVFAVSDQVRHKPGCTASEDGKPQSHIHGFGPGRATVHPDLSNRGASA